MDSLGDDQYAEGGATALEVKKTRRQEHVSEFDMHEWPEMKKVAALFARLDAFLSIWRRQGRRI